MRTPFLVLTLLALAASGAAAQNATTALSALRLIPRPEAKRLARIEAREGSPTPERWYFLIHDAAAENGLREYVVAGGEIVAARGLSQFAEAVRPEEVIGADAVKIDSERVGRVAQQYARGNGVTAAALNYMLRREAAGPTWTITCLDAAGKRLGEVVFDAGKGTVLSHGGFPREPAPEKEKPRVVRAEERPQDRESALAGATPRRVATRNPPLRAEPVRAEPIQQPPPDNSPVRKVGNSLRKLFGGERDR